uniref:Recep_L_domain domain-containing protein n=1 Tax=Panagrellus redivivus TaxID=6233 RepID=A0A7E4VE92_PANRE
MPPGKSPPEYDQLYITDDKAAYSSAKQKAWWFRTLKHLCWSIRWLLDGTSCRPIWHYVLYVDEIVKKERPIYVTDTLVLHCQSIDAFDKLIPYICGPYTRLLILGGSIRLNQLKQLKKDTVRNVKITAKIELESDGYDAAAQLIIQHVRGFRYNFDFESTHQLITEVKSAAENKHVCMPDSNIKPKECNVVHLYMFSIFLFWAFIGACALYAIIGCPFVFCRT